MPLPAIEELLLQRHEMLLLDEVLAFGPEHIEASCSLPEDHPLQDARGIPALVGIEMMAQAVSAFSGLELREKDLPPRIGLLLGTSNYAALTPFFPAGTPLRVRATLLLRDTAGLGVFSCTIHQETQLLAKAQVKGFMPDDIDRFLGTDSNG